MDLKRYLHVLAVVAAVFAFSAMTAGVAQANSAPLFTVEGKTPSAAESFAFTGKSTQAGKLEVPGLFTLTNPTEKCTVTGSITGSAPEQPGTNKEVVLSCTEAMFSDAGLDAVCVVHSPGQPTGTVITEKLKSTLVWLESTGDTAIGDTLTPEKAGSPFVVLEVTHKPGTGEICPIVGKFNVTGSIIGKVEAPTTDKETQALEFPNPPITKSFNNETPRVAAAEDKLTVGGKAASFTNTFDITLNSKALWGVEPVGGAQPTFEAPLFTVEGKTPSAAESFAFTAKSTGSSGGAAGTLEVPGLFTLTNPAEKCTVTGSITGSAPEQPGTNKEVVLSCTEAMFSDAGLDAVCVVHSPGQPTGTVITEKLKSTLVWLESTGDTAIGDTLTPEKGTSFATLQVTHRPGTGEVCPVVGNFPTTGSIIGKVEAPTTDKETQALEFPNPPITKSFNNETPRVAAAEDKLTVGGKAASFTNTFDITLNSKALWGVEPG